MPSIQFNILNQKQSPALYSDTLANRPAAGYLGRLFVSTDTYDIYRDNGTSWDLISGVPAGVVTGSGANGQVSFWTGTNTQSGDNGLFWDNTNKYLGIGITTPGTNLDIHGTNNVLLQLNSTTTGNSLVSFQNQGNGKWRVGNNYNAGANDFQIFDVVAGVNRLSITTGGTGTFTGSWTATSLVKLGGTSSQFLKADGSVDSNSYALASSLGNYLPLSGGTLTGLLTLNPSINASGGFARSEYNTSTLVATANNDVLVANEINPTYNNGSFTGVKNFALKVGPNANAFISSSNATRYGFTYDGLTFGTNDFTIATNAAGAIQRNNNVGRVIIGSANVGGAQPGYLFGLDSSQLDKGLIYDRDNSWIALINGANSNSSTYTPRLYVFNDGKISVNTATNAGYQFDINGSFRTNGNATLSGNNVYVSGAIQSSGTGGLGKYFTASGATFGVATGNSQFIVAAGTVNPSSGSYYFAGIESGGTISATGTYNGNIFGFYNSQTVSIPATANYYGFYSSLNAATNIYNIYAAGTAQSYFGGNINTNARINVNGATDNSVYSLNNLGTSNSNGLAFTGLAASTNQNLTTNTVFIFNGAGGVTWTLSNPSGNNKWTIVKNAGTASLTVAAYSGTTIIDNTGTGVASVTVAVGATAQFWNDGNIKTYQIQ